MLIALFTLLFLGGSQTGVLDYIADTRDTVKVVMEEGDRREGALDSLKAMKKISSAHNKMVKNASKDINKTLSDAAATDADIDAIWRVYFSHRATYNQDMLDLRYQLKDQMAREEWQKVFSAD